VFCEGRFGKDNLLESRIEEENMKKINLNLFRLLKESRTFAFKFKIRKKKYMFENIQLGYFYLNLNS